VGGGAHQAAVQLARPDGEVELLGPDHAHVEHVRALVAHAVGVAPRHRLGGEAHVAAEGDSQVRRVAVVLVGEHARERAADAVRGLLVELLAVEAAHVVRLEHSRIYDRLRHGGDRLECGS
jgi:hypothetical protein